MYVLRLYQEACLEAYVMHFICEIRRLLHLGEL
jgi:hypothetical protein